MSLITSCPSCGTKFRVVADQLRISDGWVRCGRCQEVFDAAQALQDAPPSASPATAASAQTEAAQHNEAAASASSSDFENAPVQQALTDDGDDDEPAPGPVPQTHAVSKAAQAVGGYELPAPPEDVLDAHEQWVNSMLELPLEPEAEPELKSTAPVDSWLSAPRTGFGQDVQVAPEPEQAVVPAIPAEPWEPVQAMSAEEAQGLQWSDAWLAAQSASASTVAALQQEDAVLAADTSTEPVLEPEEAQTADPAQVADADVEASDAPVPSFVKQAQRKAWWNKPGVRFAMGMLVILLPVALMLQIAIQERNNLVAWKPHWRPAFEAMCVALRCEIGARKHIASVVLTGSSFHQDAQPHHYRLGLSMQNQSAASVATPAVELTLTDSQGQMVVRKVLLPAEMGAPLELAPYSEWNGNLPVATQGLQLTVSGYRMLAFYP